MSINHRQVREKALGLLFAGEFHSDPDSQGRSFPLVPSAISEGWLSSESKESVEQINQLVKGVRDNQKQIDKLIEQSSHSWKIKRISIIDLNIMRMALYEMFYAKTPTPFKVCIDEALEIAKIFSTKDSGTFINGNLDAIYKKQKAGENTKNHE